MFKNLFKKNETKVKEFRVIIPKEEYALLEWEQDDIPVIGMLNTALKTFEPKEVFGWHLSLIIDFKDMIEKGMPSEEERSIVEPFCDKLDEDIKAGGNALFLVRETWNKTRRLVWRVYDPEIADQHLKYILEYKQYPRSFDYHMIQDKEWEQAKWYFQQIK